MSGLIRKVQIKFSKQELNLEILWEGTFVSSTFHFPLFYHCQTILQHSTDDFVIETLKHWNIMYYTLQKLKNKGIFLTKTYDYYGVDKETLKDNPI